jgi:regulator of sirC expression with transglutaminase-like and TPR domain
MSSFLSISPVTLSEGERIALINLLADDDPNVYRTVRSRILACGGESRQWLRPHVLSRDPVLRRRAKEIVQHFERQEADTRFLGFCLRNGEEFDLEESLWLLAQTEYPEINVEGYRAILDSYAADLRERLAAESDATEILGVINSYLFKELGFAGNGVNYYDPQNSYLNCVIDRRTGNPISLCLLYLLVARRLRLPITGIGLPGHFVCRYQSASDEIYIDTFNRGQLLSKADCVQLLQNASEGVRDEVLSPASSRRILTRICNNLHQIYRRLKLAAETTRLERCLAVLGR